MSNFSFSNRTDWSLQNNLLSDLLEKFKKIHLEIDNPRIGQIGAPPGYEVEYSDKIVGKPYEKFIGEIILRQFAGSTLRGHVLYVVKPQMIMNIPNHDKEKIKGKLVLAK